MRAIWLLLVLLPTAQAVSLELPTPPAQLTPDEAWAGELTIAVECQEMLAMPGATIEWDVDAGPYTVTGARSKLVDAADCLDPSARVEKAFAFDILGGMNITAEAPRDLEFTAKLTGDVPQSEPASKTMQVEMEYVGLIEMSTPARERQAGPQKQIQYDLDIKNLGNAQTTVDFRLIDAPDEGQVVLPERMILEVGMSAVATVSYVTPFENGNNDADESFTVQAIPTSQQGTEGQAVDEELNAKTRGLYIPGPSIVWLLAGLALWRRQ